MTFRQRRMVARFRKWFPELNDGGSDEVLFSVWEEAAEKHGLRRVSHAAFCHVDYLATLREPVQ